MTLRRKRHIPHAVAANIKAARDAKGLAGSAVAAALDISSLTYWMWEKAEADIKLTDLIRLAKVLDVTPAKLLEGMWT